MKIILVCLLLLVAVHASKFQRELAEVRRAGEKEGQSMYLSRNEIRRAGQGVLQTQSMEEAGRRAVQENQWNSDDSGGTSVVLSNLNSVQTEENDLAEREEAEESRKKIGDEERRKDEFSHNRQKAADQNRREADKTAQELEDKQREATLKQQEKFENERIQESQKKRNEREEQSQKQDQQFQEQKKKQADQLAAENKQKQDQLNEANAKKAAVDAEEAKASLRRPAWTLQYNQVLRGGDLPNTGAYSYAFWIRPARIVNEWSNILHKGQDNINRNPAIWFYPGQTRLHCRSGNARDWNAGCDPDANLPINQWTHVGLIHDSWGLRIYLNGQNQCSAQIGSPVANNGPLYVTDPWHSVAQADIADFRFYPRAIDPARFGEMVRARVGI